MAKIKEEEKLLNLSCRFFFLKHVVDKLILNQVVITIY